MTAFLACATDFITEKSEGTETWFIGSEIYGILGFLYFKAERWCCKSNVKTNIEWGTVSPETKALLATP